MSVAMHGLALSILVWLPIAAGIVTRVRPSASCAYPTTTSTSKLCAISCSPMRAPNARGDAALQSALLPPLSGPASSAARLPEATGRAGERGAGG